MDVDVEVLASLSASVDCLTRQIAADAEERARAAHAIRWFPDAVSKQADGSGNLVMGFTACPQGEWWALRSLWIGGVTAAATATGSAVVFTSTSSADSYNADVDIPFFDVEDFTTSLPNQAFYDGDAHLIPLAPNQKVCVRIYGGTASQFYAAKAKFDVYPLGTYGSH